jgi:hypothetical protein
MEVIATIAKLRGVPLDLISGGTLTSAELDILRGTLMGIPCSWLCLSEAHLRAIMCIVREWRSYYLKGDDLLAYWPMCVIARYRELLPILTGMEEQPEKGHVAPARGIFCEKAYLLTGTRKSGFVLRRERSSISIRSLVGAEPQWLPEGGNPLKDAASGIPANFSSVQYLRTRLGFTPQRRLSNLSHLVCKKLYQTAKRRGVDPYLPLELGGVGLIPRRGSYTYSLELGAALTGLHNGVDECVAYFRQMQFEPKDSSSVQARSAAATSYLRDICDLRIDNDPDKVASSEKDAVQLQLYYSALAVAGLAPDENSIRGVTVVPALRELVEPAGCAGPPSLREFFSFLGKNSKRLKGLHPMAEPPRVTFAQANILARRLTRVLPDGELLEGLDRTVRFQRNLQCRRLRKEAPYRFPGFKKDSLKIKMVRRD